MGSVNMYQRLVGKLTVAELDRFLEENARFGEVFGLDPAMLPKSWGGFERRPMPLWRNGPSTLTETC